MTDITYTLENEASTIEELYIAGLFDADYVEADPRATHMDFQLNLEAVYNLLDSGMMQVLVVRDKGEPVGFHVFTVAPQDLFTSQCVASSVCVYVLPKYRGGRVFLNLVKKSEQRAKELGAKHLYVSMAPDAVNMTRLGYHVDNVVFSKSLEE